MTGFPTRGACKVRTDSLIPFPSAVEKNSKEAAEAAGRKYKTVFFSCVVKAQTTLIRFLGPGSQQKYLTAWQTTKFHLWNFSFPITNVSSARKLIMYMFIHLFMYIHLYIS